MRIALLLACLLCAVPAAAQEPKPDRLLRAGYVALAAVTAADLETTGRALERGLHEANPLLKPFVDTPGVAGLVSGALSGGIGLGAYQLHRRGHRREARVIVWGWALTRGAVVVWNVRQLQRNR